MIGSCAAAVPDARASACATDRRLLLRFLFDRPRGGARDLGRLGLPDGLVVDVAHQHPAPGQLARPDLAERRLLALAAIDDERAARMELAAGRRLDQVGRQPLDADQPLLARLVDARP